jgi:hypothetical protein
MNGFESFSVENNDLLQRDRKSSFTEGDDDVIVVGNDVVELAFGQSEVADLK